jgi:PTH1 family peptidyl-tRNA hydrolase
MTTLRLIVGLGNPGAEYEATRHNVGFWLVERLARELKTTLAPQAKFFGRAGRNGELWLLCPATFMNRSGQSVAALARFYKIAPEEMLIVHDELDLPPGGLRVKRGGGTAGHNGLKDIQAQLGSADFWRLRVGIGHPRDSESRQGVADYVLHAPRHEEQEAIDRALDRCLQAWPKLAGGDFAGAQAVLHRAAD